MRDLKPQKSSRVKPNRRKGDGRGKVLVDLFQRSRATLARAVLALLLVAGAGLGCHNLARSDFFAVESIAIEGTHRVDAQLLLARADLETGRNIFSYDLDTLGHRMEELSWVAEARVERLLPRQLKIRVREWSPKAIVNLDCLYYMDGQGEIFKPLEAGDVLDFPVVTGLERQLVLESPEKARKLLTQAAQLLEELSRRQIFTTEEVSELQIHGTDGFTLYTCKEGVPIFLGFDLFGDKLDRLEHIYPELKPKLSALQYIDLNVNHRVIVKTHGDQTHQPG